jgi:hypothetical protein
VPVDRRFGVLQRTRSSGLIVEFLLPLYFMFYVGASVVARAAAPLTSPFLTLPERDARAYITEVPRFTIMLPIS